VKLNLKLTRSAKYNIEVKTIDTDARVILDTQINVFLDTKTKVPSAGEVFLPQFIFSDLEKEEKNCKCSQCSLQQKFMQFMISRKLCHKISNPNSRMYLEVALWIDLAGTQKEN